MGEIAAQVLYVRRHLRARGSQLRGMVLMGSGEPLDNWEATISFLEAVKDPQRLGLSLRHVTLSTSGLVPGIRQLAAYGWPLNLAVSLHAPNNEIRNQLMPINKKYPRKYYCRPVMSMRRKQVDVLLMNTYTDGLNDEQEHAGKKYLLAGRLCHVNLISTILSLNCPGRPVRSRK